jgi:energy-coupling factor transport system ATP-binding protein
MSSEPLIVFDHFSFRYASQQVETLKDIHLTLHKGEKVLIIGQSGSGKSTLVHCINGLIPNSFKGEISGSCTVAGMDISRASIFSLSKQVGTVLQDSDAQFVALSVGEDVAFALENQAIERKEMIPLVKKATDKVGMSDFLMQVPYTLSGGQKQKVSLAGVLHENVSILLFDEPLASLDPYSGMQAIELIDTIHQEDRTVIIVEHRLEDVMHREIDRVIVMHEGEIVYDGELNALLKANILVKYGLREPLYLQALNYAKIPFDKFEDVTNIQKIDFSNVQNELKTFVPKQMHKYIDHSEILLRVKNVSFAYDEKPVLKEINFTVYRGERLAFVGKNGAGKSTMAKLLCAFVRPNKGSIELNTTDIKVMTIKEVGQRIGYVMQNPNHMIVKHLIKDEVRFALENQSLTTEQIDVRVEDALKICGLHSMRNWPVSAVSYGQRKRITVAAILALKPDILILDEPTSGQDYAHYSEIMDFLDQLNKDHGITFIFITHDMHLAIEYTDRALVFADGALIADDEIQAIMANQAIIQKANLKQTSLYYLAQACDLNAETFIRSFIEHRSQS